ncbi:MAG TPA: PRC-barrel domain containing protein [Anaerolineae bacterium]|jgi:hypothetical protein
MASENTEQSTASAHVAKDLQIPFGVDVRCKGEVSGKSSYILINPVTEMVTHLVVKDNTSHPAAYMVPIEKVAASAADSIELSCTRAELEQMSPFIQTHYVPDPLPEARYYVGHPQGTYMVWPYTVRASMVYVPVEEEQIPHGELAIWKGTRVDAADGTVGHVDQFVVSPGSGNITHIVMREGHLWGQKAVTIPISAVLKTDDAAVHLKLTRHEIGELPAIALR